MRAKALAKVCIGAAASALGTRQSRAVSHAGSVSLRDDPRWPPTRYAEWRVRSQVAGALDGMMMILGSVLLVVSLLVAVATWPSDRVLVSPTDLEHWAAAALIPGWAWLMISTVTFSGFRQENYRRGWGPRPPKVAMAVGFALAVACVVTIAGGMFIGVAKG